MRAGARAQWAWLWYYLLGLNTEILTSVGSAARVEH
jgi:hypothetical protein